MKNIKTQNEQQYNLTATETYTGNFITTSYKLYTMNSIRATKPLIMLEITEEKSHFSSLLPIRLSAAARCYLIE